MARLSRFQMVYIPSVSIEKTDYIFIAGFKNPSLASAIGHHIDEPCQTTILAEKFS